MMVQSPVDLLFGGMEKLGPGSDVDTRLVLESLPGHEYEVIVDAGCGSGRQTLVLARELRRVIHAVDSHAPFLQELERRAQQARVDHLVQPYRMDMKDIPAVFRDIDLLWSEGAAYNIGFSNALETWASALRPGGFLVVSELSWLEKPIPQAVSDFFRAGYPGMQTVGANIAAAEAAGYGLLSTHTLPREAWIDGYYDILEPRARALLGHQDVAVRAFAEETLWEIEVFQSAEGSYGYVFYVLQRA
jgi:trans-aconitate methyltransferase